MVNKPASEVENPTRDRATPEGALTTTVLQPVAAYIRATNTFGPEALLAAWAARDVIGERLTLEVATVVEHYGHSIVTAHVDGLFDKRGLPNPLVFAFYFSPCDDKIVQFIILRNHSGT